MQQAMCKWDITNQKLGYLPQKNGVSTNSIGFVIEPPGLKMCLSVEASIMEHHDDKSTGCENVKQQLDFGRLDTHAHTQLEGKQQFALFGQWFLAQLSSATL